MDIWMGIWMSESEPSPVVPQTEYAHTLRDGKCAFQTDAGQQHGKLVAAVSNQQVVRPELRSQDVCDGGQYAVSGNVTKHVVKPFEIVDIDHDKCHRIAVFDASCRSRRETYLPLRADWQVP